MANYSHSPRSEGVYEFNGPGMLEGVRVFRAKPPVLELAEVEIADMVVLLLEDAYWAGRSGKVMEFRKALCIE